MTKVDSSDRIRSAAYSDKAKEARELAIHFINDCKVGDIMYEDSIYAPAVSELHEDFLIRYEVPYDRKIKDTHILLIRK